MGFEVKCAGTCGSTLRLLKDSTEGQKVYCGYCYDKRKKNEDTKRSDTITRI